MIRRAVRITFRLTHDENERYKEMAKGMHLWDWSNTIRTALKRMHTEWTKSTSDNGVGQELPLLAAAKNGVKKPAVQKSGPRGKVVAPRKKLKV